MFAGERLAVDGDKAAVRLVFEIDPLVVAGKVERCVGAAVFGVFAIDVVFAGLFAGIFLAEHADEDLVRGEVGCEQCRQHGESELHGRVGCLLVQLI